MTTMKAVVLHEYGGPEKLIYEDAPVPTPKDGEVLVKVAAASLNPVDWKLRSGALKAMMPLELPAILGRDVAGTIVQKNNAGAGAASPERVMGLVNHAYADYLVAKRSDLVAIPDGIDDIQAAALPLVLLTGCQLIERAVKPAKGWTVLVTGAIGGVGRTAVFVAKQHGATVIAGVRAKQKGKASEIGADRVVALDDDAEMAALAEVDAVADTIGGDTAKQLVQKVKRSGVFATVVDPPTEEAKARGVRVEAFHATPDSTRLAQLVEDVASGKLSIPVERTFALREAREAQTLGEKGGVAKIVLRT